MLPDDPHYQLFQTALALLQEEGHTAAAGVLMAENVEFDLRSHDNWNGGIDYYAIVIQVPIKKYAQLKRENLLDSISQEIGEAFGEANTGNEATQINEVQLRPSASASKENVTFPVETSFWEPGYYRVFISHLSAEKVRATRLKESLKKYGVTCFVAHEDIDVSTAWHDEIVKALRSMDCLIAIISKDFIHSTWCDQEVGFGLGRDVLCIPLMTDANPYGLLGKYQAMNASNKTLGEVAESVFKIIASNEKSRVQYQKTLLNLFLNSSTKAMAKSRLTLLESIVGIQKEIASSLRQHFQENSVLKNDANAIQRVNAILKRTGLDALPSTTVQGILEGDDLPF